MDKRRIIDRLYDGDNEKYLQGMEASREYGRRDVISWQDISLAATTYPELAAWGRELILDFLGFSAREKTVIKHEVSIRAIMHLFKSGGLTSVVFVDQLEEQIRVIRNQEMEEHICLEYCAADFEAYTQKPETIRQLVKRRLTHFLRYEPNIKHSLMAENFLCAACLVDNYSMPDKITELDQIAIALIKYREVLLKEGKTAADNSPLQAMIFRARFS
jgi:hypothetical protein